MVPYHYSRLLSGVSVISTVNNSITFSLFSILQFLFLSVITKNVVLFSFKVLSNSSSFSPSPLTFQVAYLNPSTFFRVIFWE